MRPSAIAAATNRIGNSSIMLGAIAGSIVIPLSCEWCTRKSATGSPPTSRAFSSSMLPPIARSTVISPARVGLRPTFSIISSLPGTSSAATMKNAAEEGSPGTAIVCGRSSASPRRRMVRVPSLAVSTVSSAPNPLSIRSEWSRVGTGSITEVIPGVFSPASSTALFTCAEATGRRYSIGTAGEAPRSISGKRPPGLAVISAPIWLSGSITRPIGRFDRLGSPVKVAVIGWEAIRPISRRVEVPLLPMSSACCGCSRPPTPTPCTRHSPSLVRSTCAPIARMAAAVARTSSPSSSPLIRLSPTASAESISARWLIDLSPGTRIVPRSGPAGRKRRGRGAECSA